MCVGGGGGGGQNSLENTSPWTESASGLCPPGQSPLADCVQGDTCLGGGGGGGGTKSAMTPALQINLMRTCIRCK